MKWQKYKLTNKEIFLLKDLVMAKYEGAKSDREQIKWIKIITKLLNLKLIEDVEKDTLQQCLQQNKNIVRNK